MRISAIIQARTGSTRLPGKVLKELPWNGGVTVLEQVVRRARKTRNIDTVIIATTTGENDDPIADIAARCGADLFRGSEDDVLERYYLAAREFGADVIVRVTSDCPCADPVVMDDAINVHIEKKAEYTSNTLDRTYPHGLDVEVISFAAMERAYNNATEQHDREHVTPYIYRTAPEGFKISRLYAPLGGNMGDIRITLDTAEDYALLCCVYDELYAVNEYFGLEEIRKLFGKKPHLKLINGGIRQKKMGMTLSEEYAEAETVLRLMGMGNVADRLAMGRPGEARRDG
ncbi:MAG: glycosyltransferase family protein [Candidatus Omnitrophica bacterium]|nr:glycosyltransferase family protein [Candidatus Omnitrophota bacterium]MDD5488835.1 glycosyltransferase family protein [Candidatus Omnitrophota bacterium]